MAKKKTKKKLTKNVEMQKLKLENDARDSKLKAEIKEKYRASKQKQCDLFHDEMQEFEMTPPELQSLKNTGMIDQIRNNLITYNIENKTKLTLKQYMILKKLRFEIKEEEEEVNE